MRRPASAILGQLWEINAGSGEAEPTSQVLKNSAVFTHVQGKSDRSSVNQRAPNLIDRHVV